MSVKFIYNISLFVLLCACGQGDTVKKEKLYAIKGTVSGLDEGNWIKVKNHNTDEIVTVKRNGKIVFQKGVPADSKVKLSVVEYGELQTCEVRQAPLEVRYSNVNDLHISCFSGVITPGNVSDLK